MKDLPAHRTNLVFLDTETTGTGTEDRLCQCAYMTDEGEREYNELFKPPLPISVDAMAVCHITNRHVEDKPPFEGSQMQQHLQTLLSEKSYVLVAHNAAFDIAMLEKDGILVPEFIDTLKLVQHLDPQGMIPRYGLQYLRYYLDFDIQAQAHDAWGDILVLEKLFERLYSKMLDEYQDHDTVIRKMISISKEPMQIKRFNFGKYKGQMVADVAQSDRGYLEWLYKEKQKQAATGEVDEDWEYTLKKILG